MCQVLGTSSQITINGSIFFLGFCSYLLVKKEFAVG